MNTTATNAKKAAINAAKLAREPLETLRSQAAPFVDEFKNELFSSFKSINRQSRSLAQEELQRARIDKEVKEKKAEDDSTSSKKAQEFSLMLQEYRNYDTEKSKK